MWQSLFFNKVAGWSNCFWSFSYLLLKISHLFHFNRNMILKSKIPWWSSNIYFFAQVSPLFAVPPLIYTIQIPPLPKIFILYISNIYSKNRMEAWGFCTAEKKQERYKKRGSHMIINHDIETVRECSVHDSK